MCKMLDFVLSTLLIDPNMYTSILYLVYMQEYVCNSKINRIMLNLHDARIVGYLYQRTIRAMCQHWEANLNNFDV